MRALVLLVLLLPAAAAAPFGATFEERWEQGAGAWRLEGPARVDCAVGNAGCSLAVEGMPRSGVATTRLPQIMGFTGTLSADVRAGADGDGSSLLAAQHETGFTVAYFEPQYQRVSLTTSAGQWRTAYLPIEAGRWYHLELRVDAQSVSYRVLDGDGATLATIGPVPTSLRLALLRSIEISGYGMTEAPHHWDNVLLVADAPALATLK